MEKLIFHYEKCLMCDEDIVENEKFCRINDWLSVHCGECLNNYQQLLNSPEEVKFGKILDSCACCGKPVREEQDFKVFRDIPRYDSIENKEQYELSTVPSPENKDRLLVAHVRCLGAVFSGSDAEVEE